MTTKDVERSSIHYSQDILWPVSLVPSEDGEVNEAIIDDSSALTVFDLGDHLVALSNNALLTAGNNDISILPCNIYKGSTSDFYMHANFGYRLMWEVGSELQVVALQPKNLAAITTFRCGTCVSEFSLSGSVATPSMPSTLEDPARRGIVPNPKGVKISSRHEALEALARALQTDAKLYLSTAGNLYLPITNLLREYLVESTSELILPTALFTYEDYQLTDLSNKEEVDDIEWLTGSYVEYIREELARDKQLAEHLVSNQWRSILLHFRLCLCHTMLYTSYLIYRNGRT